MLTTAQTFTWPVKARAVAYIQVGDLVEMLFHNKASAFAACEFCRTANHKCAGRCHICGGMLPLLDDEDRREPAEAKSGDTALLSDVRSLANTLLLVVMPALLLFGGFAGWQFFRSNTWIPAAEPAVALASPAKRAAASLVLQTAKDRALGVNLGLSQSEALPSSPDTPRFTQGDVGAAQRSLSASSLAPRSALNESRRTTLASRHQEQNPLSACDAGNFFARAICINSRCADPKTARLGQCPEAVRQRRIDEARRNPTLVG